jgi:hypothetical protein
MSERRNRPQIETEPSKIKEGGKDLESIVRESAQNFGAQLEKIAKEPAPDFDINSLPNDWKVLQVQGEAPGKISLAYKIARHRGSDTKVLIYPETFLSPADQVILLDRLTKEGVPCVMVTQSEFLAVRAMIRVKNGLDSKKDHQFVVSSGGKKYPNDFYRGCSSEPETAHLSVCENGEPDKLWPGGFFIDRTLLDYTDK